MIHPLLAEPLVVNDFLKSEVVIAFLQMACLTGYGIDATAVEIRPDEDTGFESPTDVRYKGLAVIYVEPEYGYALCISPTRSEPIHLCFDNLNFIRIDAFAGVPEMDPPS